MAISPAHKLGQIIGDVLEVAIEPILKKFAEKHNLFLDKKGSRKARPGLKVTWTDSRKNSHDLDFVLERGGTEEKIGTPVAFIEVAWRRYTKHSRNKAQEIQGAIVPLAETYSNSAPFKGVVLAGVFTQGALQQLKSLGFCVLYFDYDSLLQSFKQVGIDVSFDERTSLRTLEIKVKKWDSLGGKDKARVSVELIKNNSKNVNEFIVNMERAVARNIEIVRILPLHGRMFEYKDLSDAINFIKKYDEEKGNGSISRYEVEIRYSNKDEIRGIFEDKEKAIDFLSNYL